MLDFEVQRCSRKCASTGRELKPGDICFSVLVPDGASVQRVDFSAEGWHGPPDNALGWWRSRIAEPSTLRMHWAPNDVLLDYFQRLVDVPEKSDERYVLALLLVRRRILRLEETATDAQGNDVLTLFCPRHEITHQVVARMPDAQRVQQIQDDLGRLLLAPGAEPSSPTMTTLSDSVDESEPPLAAQS